MANYTTEAAALAGAGVPGWTVTGREREFKSVTSRDENNQVVTTQEPTGNTILTVQSPDGAQHDSITVGSADDPSVKGGQAITVVKGAQQTHPAAGSPINQWDRLDAKGNVITAGDTTTPAVALRDPKAPAGSQPYTITGGSELGDPSTWTPIREDPKDDTSRVVGLYDPKSQKVAASVSQSTTDKDSDPSKWVPVYRVPGDSSSGIIGQQDPVNHVLHPVASAPDGTQIVTTPTAIYTLDKTTGNVINKQDVAPGDVNKQAVTVGGKVYTFDPKDGSFTLPTNVQEAATVGNSTTLKDLVWYDSQGNQVGSTPNTNYGKAPVTAPTPNTVAPMIQVPESQVTPGGDPSKLVWIPNQGQVTASDALKQLASHLSGQVVDGKVSIDEAKDIIDASNAKMTADNAAQTNVTTAAGDVLSNTRGNAQTAAGLLQQRVQAATGTLQNILGNALSNKNITSVPGDVGTNLVQGLQGWTSDLMGGQNTMDSAARMIQAADPKSNFADPTTQAATAALQQMLDKYQQLNGGVPHPLAAADQSAQQTAQNGGLAAPNTFNPQASTAALNAGGYQDTPAGRAAAAAAQPSLLATPATQATQAVAAGFQAPPTYGAGPPAGANYGNGVAYTGGVPPWLAGPQPAFMAPVTG